MASEDAVVTQGLECCLCFELFTEPKLLSCTHTFCKKCLERLYKCQPQPNHLSCPICHKVTNIKTGIISHLQTNIPISSLIQNVKSAKRSCSICDPEAKCPAVLYCMQCDEYMCHPCSVAHGKFKKTAKHDVVSVDDVKRGKVKVKRFCNKHPEEEKLYVCTSCNESICFRCRMLDHNQPGHHIEQVSDFKKTIERQIKSLQEKATAKIGMIETHSRQVNEQNVVVEVELDRTIAEINQAYEETVQHLTRQRNNLIDQCKREKGTLTAQLEKIKKSDDKLKSRIRSASELVGNGIKTLLEGQTMAVHKEISCDLQKMLGEINPNVKNPKSIGDHAKGMKFVGSITPNNLGDLIKYDWLLEEVSPFPLSHEDPQDAVALSDGRVAVGYCGDQAIEMFTVDGPQETALRGVEVRWVSVLSDGRYVVRDSVGNIRMYTQAWERLDVRFHTPSDDGFGSMCVDRDDNIYVSYRMLEKIFVFLPEGGAPLREIPCHGIDPWEICHTNHSNRLVVRSRSKTVSIIDDIDGTGNVLHHIKINSWETCIAVLMNDSILVGCRKDGYLNVKLYDEDLMMIRTVLSDFPLRHYIRKLIEMPTGEIVLISDERFSLFAKS